MTMVQGAALNRDFEATKLRETIAFECALVGVTAVYCFATAIARLLAPHMVNAVPAISSGAIMASHLMSMWLRWRNPGLFWPSICNLVGDSMWIALGNTSVQALLWEAFWGRLLVDDLKADPFASNLMWQSLWSTFIVYMILNYQSTFVLSFRQAAIASPIAAIVHSAACVAGRFHLLEGYGSESHSAHLAMELVLFWGGIAMTTYSKWRSEMAERRLFIAQKKIIIDERSLRCQAEFQLEIARAGRMPGACSTAESNKSSSCSKPRKAEASENGSCAQFSIISAPANMTPGQLASFFKDAVGASAMGPDGGGCFESNGMDCLPLDAQVWIEGSAAPSPLQELAQGQRVLCYDSLGNDVRYASVLSARSHFEDVEWVTVRLEDGTELTMTSDHPVQPKRSAGTDTRRDVLPPAVKAAHLSPGTDSIVVHRVVTRPVAVRSVSQPEVCQGRGRMYVTLQHPDRHSLLVAGPGARKDVRSMAVGSADAGAIERPALELRNTFLDLPSGSDLKGEVRRRRAHSEPPGYKQEAAPGHVEEEFGDMSSQGNPSTISPESGEDGCNVRVLDTTPAAVPGGGARPAAARVSDLLNLNRMGLPSLGSARHGSNDCRLCDFFGRPGKHGGCRSGKFCRHCHIADDHELTKNRGGAKHNRTKKTAGGSSGDGER